MGNLRSLGQHDGRRAVLFSGELDRAFNLGVPQIGALYTVVNMDAGEYLRWTGGPLGFKFHHAIRNWLARFAENMNDVKGRAASHTDQQHLHGTHSAILATFFGGAVHRDCVPTAGLAHKRNVFNPLDACSHCFSPLFIGSFGESITVRQGSLPCIH